MAYMQSSTFSNFKSSFFNHGGGKVKVHWLDAGVSHHIELESYLLNKFSLNVTQIARYLQHAIPTCKKACLRAKVLMSFYECQPHFRNTILQIKA